MAMEIVHKDASCQIMHTCFDAFFFICSRVLCSFRVWFPLSISHPSPVAACVLALLTCGSIAAAADYEPGAPSTFLFDTGSSSAGILPTAKLNRQADWTLVPEDDLAHKFRGDALVLNDRLAVVLRSAGTGAEIYGQTAQGANYRAEISPRTQADRKPTALSSLQIVENGPAAITLKASFAMSGGSSCSLKYRITAGQVIVEVRPGQGTDRLAVLADTRYVVVPEFFGHDMVFGPRTMSRPRLRLPAENMLLSLLDSGNAEVMCVWSSNRQEAIALRSTAVPAPQIAGCEIQAAGDKPLWIACLEGTGLWHELATAPSGKTAQPADWKLPFPAKWHVDVLHGSSEAMSSWLGDGTEIHKDSPPTSPPSATLVYALDRSQATPLTMFTPIDILRGTLGVGPCQYILQTEGLASDSDPTPDNVMTWIEKQFSRKKEKKSADEIRERLAQMVKHIGQTQSRIEQYRQMFEVVDRLCNAAADGSMPPAEARGSRAILASLARSGIETTPSPVKLSPAHRARLCANQVIDLIGSDGAIAECEKLGGLLRAIGTEQDHIMAVFRMRARWLRQSAAMLAEDHPGDADLAGKVRSKVEEMLRTN
jgi:hypothetical protein